MRPALCRVAREGVETHVEHRVMAVLVCLASRPGDVISRDALLEAVWPDTMVNEEALTRAISDLRRALADDPKDPKVIETIRKSGYRLMVPVVSDAGEPGLGNGVQVGLSRPAVPAGHGPARLTGASFRTVAGMLGLVALAAVALLAAWAVALRHAPAARSRALDSVPFTATPGIEQYPALSPDGTRLAYNWTAELGAPRDIYVKQRNADRPVLLVGGPDDEYFPAWSPDGGTIAFYRTGPRAGIYVIPAIGGPERCLARTGPVRPRLAWTPDGRSVAFVLDEEGEVPPGVLAVPVTGGPARRLTAPGAASHGDLHPAFSPDGRWLAFVRRDSGFGEDIHVVGTSAGAPAAPRRLSSGMRTIVGLDWTADGRSLVCSAARDGRFHLWQVRVRDGALTWLSTPDPGQVLFPTTSRTGRRLAYEATDASACIQRVRMAAPGRGPSEPESLVVSTLMDRQPRLSGDGAAIAFVSTRTGFREIWVCDRTGGGARQVTDLKGADVTRPCWSPDGRRLAFAVETDGLYLLRVTEVAGGPLRLLARTPFNQDQCVWSADSRRIYFVGDTRRGRGVWSLDVADGRLEAALGEDATLPAVSVDGRSIFYVERTTGRLMRVSAAGGPARTLLGCVHPEPWVEIVPVRDGLYLARDVRNRRALDFYGFATGRLQPALRFPQGSGANLTATADGRTLLFESLRADCDLKLVQDYR